MARTEMINVVDDDDDDDTATVWPEPSILHGRERKRDRIKIWASSSGGRRRSSRSLRSRISWGRNA